MQENSDANCRAERAFPYEMPAAPVGFSVLHLLTSVRLWCIIAVNNRIFPQGALNGREPDWTLQEDPENLLYPFIAFIKA